MKLCFLVFSSNQETTTNKERTNRMIRLFNQSIGRLSLTKTKTLIPSLLIHLIVRHRVLGLLLGGLVTIGMATYGADTPSSTTWYSGQRAFAQIVVEPAVDLATGNQIFLLTPNNVSLTSNAAQRAHAPLFLVLYPDSSAVPTSSLNCTPSNCGHLQTWAYPLKGHDHLVGVPHTGDFNIAWDVILVSFTQQGFDDGAINTRILTLAQLDAATTNGDVVRSDVVLSFVCSITSVATYLHGTPLSFPVP